MGKDLAVDWLLFYICYGQRFGCSWEKRHSLDFSIFLFYKPFPRARPKAWRNLQNFPEQRTDHPNFRQVSALGRLHFRITLLTSGLCKGFEDEVSLRGSSWPAPHHTDPSSGKKRFCCCGTHPHITFCQPAELALHPSSALGVAIVSVICSFS